MTKQEREFDYLEHHGFLEYGNTIPKHVFEQLLGVRSTENMAYIGPLLALKQHLDEEGYLCSIREWGIHIYEAYEQAEISNRIFKNQIKRMKRIESCLAKADYSNLPNSQLRKHVHAANKISAGLNALKSTLASI